MSKGISYRSLSTPRAQVVFGIGVIGALFTFHVLFLLTNINTKFDDAYMFIRYADNVLRGHGIAWNPDGVQTYGVTSLLYLFLIVIVRWFFPLANSSIILTTTSFTLGLCALAFLVVGCGRLADSDFVKTNKLLLSICLTIILMSSRVFLLQATSGMDTTLSLLCNTMLIFATLDWAKRPGPFATLRLVFAAYASFLARPDALLYALFFPVLYGWFFLPADKLKRLFQFGSIFAATLALDTLIKYWVFGDPLPLPFYAKSTGFYDGYLGLPVWNPVSYLFIFGRQVIPFILILIFASASKSWRLVTAFFLPVLITFLYYFLVIQIMGGWARYYFPALPFFVLCSFLVLDQRLQISNSINNSNILLRSVFSVLMGLFLFVPFIQTKLEGKYEANFLVDFDIYKSKYSEKLTPDLPRLGWWEAINAMSDVAEHLPAGTRVAMSEHGVIGANAPQIYIIDLLGLHDPFFAHNGFTSTELFRRRPDMIWFPNSEYSKMFASIQDDPTLRAEYDFYPSAFDFGLAVWRGAEKYTLINEAIAKVWHEVYPGFNMEEARFTFQ